MVWPRLVGQSHYGNGSRMQRRVEFTCATILIFQLSHSEADNSLTWRFIADPGDLAPDVTRNRAVCVSLQGTCNFPVNAWQGSLSFKAYKEFWAQNRPDGCNVWLTLSVLPPAPPR